MRDDVKLRCDLAYAAITRDGSPPEIKRLTNLLEALRRENQELMEDLRGDELLHAQGACRLLRNMLLTLSREPGQRKHHTGSYQ